MLDNLKGAVDAYQKFQTVGSLLENKESPQAPEKMGFFDKLKNGLFGKIFNLFSEKNPEAVNEAKETQKNSLAERQSFFGELTQSLFLRQFPKTAQALDLVKGINSVFKFSDSELLQRGPEVVAWQHEFETITALTMLIPNSFLKYLTDPIANSSIFQKIVEKWPLMSGADLPLIGNDPMIDRVRAKDPDAVIQALRVIHQDVFVTGKVALDKVKSLF